MRTPHLSERYSFRHIRCMQLGRLKRSILADRHNIICWWALHVSCDIFKRLRPFILFHFYLFIYLFIIIIYLFFGGEEWGWMGVGGGGNFCYIARVCEKGVSIPSGCELRQQLRKTYSTIPANFLRGLPRSHPGHVIKGNVDKV